MWLAQDKLLFPGSGSSSSSSDADLAALEKKYVDGHKDLGAGTGEGGRGGRTAYCHR